jgi:hypothetical protein
LYEQLYDKQGCDDAKNSQGDDMPWVRRQKKDSSAMIGCFIVNDLKLFFLFDSITIKVPKFQNWGEKSAHTLHFFIVGWTVPTKHR